MSGETGVLARLRQVGPGAMVAAAFVGPGTVTTASLAGARFGTALLWALLFSVVATVVLQEMAARLGLVTGRGLGEALRARFPTPAGRRAVVGLVLGAVVAGNAAYETGNLLGGALGAEALAGGDVRGWSAALAVAAAALLWTASYRVVERALVALVGVMGIAFLATAVVASPPVPELLRGLLPGLPGPGALLVAVGLVGTTVVPYNLFLHASAVNRRWSRADELGAARADALLSIGIGGLASAAVLVTAAAAPGGRIEDAADMALQLEPVLGGWARLLFSAGLLAAGLTSAVTAPLAASWATAGVLGWEDDPRSPRVRAVWTTVLGTGGLFALLGVRPVPAILFAQVANGVLLPVVALFLLIAVNDARQMGPWRNGPLANTAGALVVLVALGLGLRAVLGAL